MTVRTILENKGYDVLTLDANETIATAIRILAENRVGALVVVNETREIAGILSERDIVRVLAREGAVALESSVHAAMTSAIKVCNENHTINDLMEIMTANRFRHIPVERNGSLVGIVSIGDVVKKRIEDVEREAEEIKTYITMA